VRARRVLVFGIAVIAYMVVATLVAVIANWPAQLGGVGTDARSEMWMRGTALSAPLLPVAVLIVSLVLVDAGGRWATAGLAVYSLVGVGFGVGGLGEALAPATPDVPKAVLVSSGVISVVIATTMVVLALSAFRQRRRSIS
jgi:hypothetical protein